MFVAPCPHCHDSVTVPSRARPTSRVRCPLCTTEFTLDEMMDGLPPALELLDEAGGYGASATYAAHEGGESDVATLVAGGADDDMALADAEARSERPSYSFDGEGGTATETAPRKAVRTTPRPKKKPKNMVLEMVKIVLGGLMAFPISMLILWTFGRDPFGLAPTVVEHAPFMKSVISEELYKAPASKPTNNANKGGAAKANAPKPQPVKPPSDFGSEKFPTIDLNNNKPADPTTTLPGTDPLAPPVDFEPVPMPSDPLEENTTTIDPPSIDPLPIDPLPTPEPAPATAETLVKDAPRYTAAEVAEATKTATNAVQAWTEGSPEATRQQKADLLRSLYMALAQLGEKFAFADPGDKGLENNVPAVREVLFSLQAEADVMSTISRVGPAWLNPTTRKSDGILLTGTVKEITAREKLFETKVQLEDEAKTTVTVVSQQDPAQSYQPDDRVMVLGVIVSEPSNITGYAGDAPLAIVSPMAIRVAE